MKGFCWHVHHGVLMEWCHDYEERVAYIKAAKSEVELRLHLFQPVKGELPAVVVESQAAYDKARAAYDKARAAYLKAQAACDEAIPDNMPAILELHAQECPDCPWDGMTIFPEAK